MMRTLIQTAILAALIALPLLAETPAAPESKGRRVIIADSSKGHVVIIGVDGKVEWEHRIGPLHDLHMLPGGNVLLQTNWTNIAEVTPDKKIVWQYDAGKSNGNEGKKVEVHAFQRLANGNTMIAESGPGRIIEVDANGKLVHQIKMKVDHPNPHRDTRLARKLDNGHYLACHEGDGAVREYDGEGKVVWEYPVPLFDKPVKGGHGVESFGNSVFSAIRLANGNTLIGTGNGHSVLEVTPAKEIVWKIEQNDLPGIQLAWVTTVERLANGNTLIGNCHAGPKNPQLIEVTPDRKVVWKLHDWTVLGDATTNSQALDEKGSIR